MTLRDILSADMPTVRRWFGQGWRWWIDQLAGMVPGGGWLTRHRGAVVEHAASTPGGWQVAGTGQRPDRLPARRRRNVLITLDETDILCRTIDAPVLSPNELRQMIALDIDRIGPMPMGAACFDQEVVGRTADTLSVLIGMVPQDRLSRWVGELAAMDIMPSRIAMRDRDGQLHFDFSAIIDRSDGKSAWTWWTIVALLFAGNVAALIWRDVASTAALRDAVEEQAPAGRTALMIRTRVIQAQQRRAELVRARNSGDPLASLAAISSALPRGAFVQRFEGRGQAVRLVGYAPANLDVSDILRQSPLVASVSDNGAGSEMPGEPGQMLPFDLGVTIRPGARP